MLLQSICLKDLRMRPSIEFAFLDGDAVWCLNESSLSIPTPKSFSHVVSSSTFYSLSCVVSHCVCVAWGVFPYPQNCALLFIEI